MGLIPCRGRIIGEMNIMPKNLTADIQENIKVAWHYREEAIFCIRK